MAEYSGAAITIGGSLSRTLLSPFLAAIVTDHLSIDYGDRIIEEEDIVSGEPLKGASASVRCGEFAKTEEFCRRHGLRYIRRSDACVGVWDPSIEIFTGGGAAMYFGATTDGAVVLSLGDFRRLGSLAAIEAHFAAADFDPGPLTITEP